VRVLIIHDERLARIELRRLLAALPEVDIAGEARNAAEARPDRRASTGSDLSRHPDARWRRIELRAAGSRPAVIFTTAFDHYAPRAFEVSALDYPVKPIAPDRLAAAVVAQAARLTVPSSIQPNRQVLG
jgi:two-component system LytT family response regulator